MNESARMNKSILFPISLGFSAKLELSQLTAAAATETLASISKFVIKKVLGIIKLWAFS